MKYILSLALAALSTPAFAGHPMMDKNPAGTLYGTGFYGGVQVGANLYQHIDQGSDLAGLPVSIDLTSNVGIFAGLKLGYVIGTGSVRPAIEFDGYYNGFETDIGFRADVGGVRVRGDGTATTHSGAFLANFLLRLNCQSRFQPYLGAGVGLYYAQDDSSVTARAGGARVTASASSDSTGLAWQAVAGSDYYFTEKMSVFVEYKFLNYENIDSDLSGGAIRQHLLGLGVRLHF